MRKKLLALMMCATMVLSTAATAFAGPADDAKAIYDKNYKKFAEEIEDGDSEVIVKKVLNVIQGSDPTKDKVGEVEYGYKTGANGVMNQYTPCVVYVQDTKAEGKIYVEALEVADTFPTASKYSANGNPSVAASEKILSRTAAGEAVTGKYYAVKVALNDNTEIMYLVKNEGSAPVIPVYKKADDKTSGTTSLSYVSGTENFVQYPANGNLTTAKSLVKATKDLFTSADGSTVYTSMGAATVGTSNQEFSTVALMSAIKNGDLTKNAVAVKMTNMLVMPGMHPGFASLEGVYYNTGAKQQRIDALYNATKMTSGSYALNADLLSRTSLKDAEAISVIKQTGITYDAQYNSVAKFEKVATLLAADEYSFDNTASWFDGVIIFDKGDVADVPTEEATTEEATTVAATEAATEAPAETTTTAQASLEKAPQMGDTTPIAALAVVMMGAVGAMVVASKKRA